MYCVLDLLLQLCFGKYELHVHIRIIGQIKSKAKLLGDIYIGVCFMMGKIPCLLLLCFFIFTSPAQPNRVVDGSTVLEWMEDN